MLSIVRAWNTEDIVWTTAFSVILVASILGNTLVGLPPRFNGKSPIIFALNKSMNYGQKCPI